MANNVKLLSGKQLVENGGKKSDSYLPDKGPKSVIPNGSWLEKKQVESALEARKCTLELQRIEKRGSLTQAEWIEAKQKAHVTEMKGGQWKHMGKCENFHIYLLPEETLHLMEMNSLQLKYGGVPVSIQQAYSLLIGKSLSLDEYRVYSMLSRQGYKLIRYDKDRTYSKNNCDSEDSEKSEEIPQKDISEDVENQSNNTAVELTTISNNTAVELTNISKHDSVQTENNLSSSRAIPIIIESEKQNDLQRDALPAVCTNAESKNTNVDDSNVQNSQSNDLEMNDDIVAVKSNDNHKDKRHNLQCDSSLQNNAVTENEKINQNCSDIKTSQSSPPQENNIVHVEINQSICVKEKQSNVKYNSSNCACVDSKKTNSESSDVQRPQPETLELNDLIITNQNNEIEESHDQQKDVQVNDSNCVELDSSSDDCMVIIESCHEEENSKRSASNNEIYVCNQSEHMSVCDSDATEVQYLPSFSFKLKILDSIPNCYRKNWMHLKAPDIKFLPPDVTLNRENYVLNLDKLSNKYNCQEDDMDVDIGTETNDPSVRAITNYSHNDRSRPNHNRNNNRNDHYNNRSSYNNNFFNSHYMGGNNFANNAYFLNYIFQNMSRPSNLHFANFHFMSMNGMFPRFNNLFSRPFCFPQWNRQYMPQYFPGTSFCNVRQNCFQNGQWNQTFQRQNNNCHSRVHSASGGYSRSHESCSNSNKRNKNDRRDKNNQNNFTDRPSTSCDSTPAKQTPQEQCKTSDGYLQKIKTLISKFSSMPSEIQSKELKNGLKLTVDKFNSEFSEHYTLVFERNKCFLKKSSTDSDETRNVPLEVSQKRTAQQESEKVLQLSSDSDCPPIKISRFNNCSPSSDSRIKKRVKRTLRSKRSKSDCQLVFQVNTVYSSSDSDIEVYNDFSIKTSQRINSKGKFLPTNTRSDSEIHLNSNTQITSDNDGLEVRTRKNSDSVDHSKDKTMFGSWYPKNDSWGKPVYCLRKPKQSHVPSMNFKISHAIMNNIRELSYEKQYAIESWGQAKQLFERRNVSNTVCISDDESTPNEAMESRIGDSITVKIEKIQPLVRAQDCTSVSTVLNRLQIIKSAFEDKMNHENINENERLKISYDIYLPNFKTLKKSHPPSPAFSVIVLSDKSPLPTPEALSEISESLPPEVPFLVAVVSLDTVSFMQIEHVNLPSMIRDSSSGDNL